MRSRGLRIFILLYVSVWFGAIVPGHTRGIVKMPGSGGGGGDAPGRVSSDAGCCATHAPADDQKQSPVKPACAVCYFAAALMVAPPATFDFAQLGLVGSLAPPVIDRIVCPPAHQPYSGRAPPVTA
ncbi:MAG TPA: hypothetical protein VGN72_22555 [Tepidisphaeraceae bacterium]|nr:hypothetical protein [Tepidisphaeraceae bacterium]